LCALLDQAARSGWSLVALDVAVDTTTPMGRAMAQISGAFAELERALIAQRTRDALAAKRAKGARLGRPRSMDPATSARIQSLRDGGATLTAIADELNAEGVPTARGGRCWYPATVRTALRSAALDAEAAALRETA